MNVVLIYSIFQLKKMWNYVYIRDNIQNSIEDFVVPLDWDIFVSYTNNKG